MTKNNLNYIDEEVRKLRTENEIDRQQERTDAVAMTYRDGAASAGEQTMVSLNAARYEGDDAAADTESAPAPGGFSYEPYKPSDAVTQAEALLQEQLGKKPGEYTSQWQAQLEETIGKILNREKFSYDLNEDALYQQYKDSYIRQGQMAMMDTMGQAQAMTGGYGNSYAQGVGQQAYQSYLQRLNEVVPELYGMARDQYNQEGQALYDRASLMASMEDQEYGRYRDYLSDYYTELSRLTEDSRYKGETEYNRWATDRGLAYDQFITDRAYDHQLQQEQFARDEAIAQLMASVGDYSLLGQLYGLTEEQIAALSGETKKKSGGGQTCPKCGKLKSQCVCNNKVLTATDATDSFEKSLTTEDHFDAIMRSKWGSYRGYVGNMIDRAEKSGNLTQDEADYLALKYKITSADNK